MKADSIGLYLLYFVYTLPVIFQLIAGTQILRKKSKLSLLKITLISCSSLVVIAGINFLITFYRTNQTENHDGLWIVGIGALFLISVIFIFLISGIQSLVFIFQKNRKI